MSIKKEVARHKQPPQKNILDNSSISQTDENELSNISEKTNVLPLFPINTLPTPLADFVKETANCLPCPVDYVGLNSLITLGTAIGNSAEIQIDEDWFESALLFGASVGEPSVLKTPSQSKSTEPLEKLQDENYELYLAQLEEYEDQLKDHEEWKKSKNKKKEEEPHVPEEPTFKQHIVSDLTMESLPQIIKDNPRGVCAIYDELIDFLDGMDKYRGGKGSDKGKWLSIYNRKSFPVNRVSKKPIQVRKPFVSISGNITPDNLYKIISKNQDGFPDRFLFTYPKKVPAYYQPNTVPTELKERYQRIVEQLLDLNGDMSTPVKVHFTSDSKQLWTTFHDSIVAMSESPECPKRLQSVLIKYKAILARLTLIIHLTKFVCKETLKRDLIDIDTVEQAYELTLYYIEHAKKVYDFTELNELELKIEMIKEFTTTRGNDFVDEVTNYKKGKLIKIRELNRGRVFSPKYDSKVEFIHEVLEEMVKQEMGYINDMNPTGRPSLHFFLYEEYYKEN